MKRKPSKKTPAAHCKSVGDPTLDEIQSQEVETIVTINGQKIACLVVTGANGKTWKRYGPLKDGKIREDRSWLAVGFLHYYESSGKWSVMFDYNAVVTDITLAKKRGKERDFLSELETLHVASMKSEWHRVSSVAPARRMISHALSQAIKELDPEPFEKMASSIKALVDLEKRDQENERIIQSVIVCARTLGRVPCKGEVRDYHNKTHHKGKNSYEAQGWNPRLETIGFSWLPNSTRGKVKIG